LNLLSFGASPRIFLPEASPAWDEGAGGLLPELKVGVRTALEDAAAPIRAALRAAAAAGEAFREERASLARALARIRSSISWRLTAPLRAAGPAVGYRGAGQLEE
jgi:hypothetical protein